ELASLLISQRLVLLHSPSGAGKTSLIHTKLVPALQDEFLVPTRWVPDATTRQPVIVRLNRAPEPTDPPGANRYLLSALLSLEQHRSDGQPRSVVSLAGMTLDEYLTELHALLKQQVTVAGAGAEGESPLPFRPLLLVFDQFEELLTLDPTDQGAKWAFVRQL